ncbi:MAG: hypothetical protein ACYC7E_05760 [Armatimonadota bacterium]
MITNPLRLDPSAWLEVAPDVRLKLALQDDRLLGIGEVMISGVPQRAATIPLRPDFATPDAVHYQDFVLREVVRQGEAIVVKTTALGRPEIYGTEMMDEYDFTLALLRTRGVQEDALDWIITPQALELDGERYRGFSLGFRFASASNAIHRFTTVGTWEIGGRAAGNTVYQQSQVSPPVYEAAVDTHFTSACLKRLDMWHDLLGNSYQLTPRWGSMQPFDFQTAKEGVFFSYWTEPHSVKSLMQKNPGEDVIFVLDEYGFPLAMEVEIPAKHVLFSATPEGGRAPHEIVNMWTRASDHSTQIIRDFFGITQSYPIYPCGDGAPPAGRVYVDRSELADGPQDDWMWRQENGKFYYMRDGEKVESRDILYWTADHTLPKLHAQGVTRMQTLCHESDFTALAFAYHAETGEHGELHVASVCGSHRYQPAEFFGGWPAWHYLAEKAEQYGISLGHWVGLHLTLNAPIAREHPDYIIQHSNTKRYGGGYGHHSICSINWRSGARQWFLDDMQRFYDAGLRFIWFDSWPNMASLPYNYGGDMAPMQYEMASVLGDLQRIGYDWFGYEGTSPFGVHAYGMVDPMKDYEGHVSQGVAGQNDFGKWIGHEYMAYNQSIHIVLNDRRDRSHVPEWSFRYMANRSTNMVSGENFRTYMALMPLMKKRYLLPDDRGVRWDAGDGRQALFAYAAFPQPIPSGAKVNLVQGTEETPVACPSNILQAQPWSAYRIG